MRVSSSSTLRRPRGVWAALATAVIMCSVQLLGVLLPIVGLIAAADASIAGALHVPVGAITLSIVVGYGISLVFLVLTFLARRIPLAWIFAVSAIVANLLGSVWPLFATAFASVDQAQDVIPFIADLVGKLTGN